MILYSFALAFLLLALVFILVGVTSRTAEKFLWGISLSSLFLGLAIQLLCGGYWGFLALGAFFLTDLIVYLVLRSQGFRTEGAARFPKFDRVQKVFFLWFSFCLLAAFFVHLFFDKAFLWNQQPVVSESKTFEDSLWGTNWILLLVAMGSIVTAISGGYFLVRKEQEK